ncbi:hypothetical protein PIB30_028947 [Stylosanthes scabra]|uniref:DUF4283 domain-containing protein n=1 Tax=Stylosanthes scabra TaxID=79078 RepID=A0ABU6TC86_9FABA|nr:hypothetical protein [Stylosanthes scabra]
MNVLLDEWNGLGNIECRDVGPYRYLVSFSSVEIRDQAMSNELLLSVFDEVRHHWDFVSSISRRVWVEIMGLPVNLWCIENFQSISKLWGKFILVDDRTGDPKSFNITRVMLDCFQWKQIHEWISLKIGDRVIDVVKEVGAESYSMESHPNREVENSGSSESLNSMSMVGESLVEVEETRATSGHSDLNWKNVEDPLINAIIAGKLGANLCPLFDGTAFLGVGVESVIGGVVCDSVTHRKIETSLTEGVVRKSLAEVEANEVWCVQQGNKNRAPLSVQIGSRVDVGISDNEEGNIETLHYVNGDIEAQRNLLSVGATPTGIDGVFAVAASGGEGERSEETLYRINEQVFCRNAFGNFGDLELESADAHVKPIDADLEGVQNCAVNGVRGEFEEVVGMVLIGNKTDDVSVDQVHNQWKLVNDDLTEEDNSLEVVVAKGVWDKGGIFFDSSDEEEVVTRFTGRKVQGRKRSKKFIQTRNLPCIEGRTLATRKLRLATKSKQR